MYIYTNIPPAESLYCCSYLFVFRADHLGLEDLSGKKKKNTVKKTKDPIKTMDCGSEERVTQSRNKNGYEASPKVFITQQLGKCKLKTTWQFYFIPSRMAKI